MMYWILVYRPPIRGSGASPTPSAHGGLGRAQTARLSAGKRKPKRIIIILQEMQNMKKALSIFLTALLALSVLSLTVSAAEPNLEYLECEAGNTEPLERTADGFDGSEDAAAALADAGNAIGKTPLTGIYTFLGGTESFGGEGPENLWDNSLTTKFCTGTFPTISAAALDGKYKIDGLILATANDNASYNDRNPFEWYLYASNDAQSWTCIAQGDDTFFEETNFTYYPCAITVDGEWSFLMWQSEGALSGCFQMSELVICGTRTGDADTTVEVDLPEVPVYAEYVDYEAGSILANNGTAYDTEDAAVAALGGSPAIKGGSFVLGTLGNNNEGPENLWDHDTATKFCNGTAPFVSIWKYDEDYTIDGVIMATANDNSSYNGRSPATWAIFGSKDGENWTLLANGDVNFLKEADGTELDFTYYCAPIPKTAETYNYILWEADSAEVPGTFQLSEVVLTGTSTAPGFGSAAAALESVGKTIVIEGITGEGGSASFDNEGPDNLWDGDTATKFCTNTLPAEAKANLNGTWTIDGIAIALANDNADYGRIPTAWTLSGSNDGENWTEITSGDNSMFVQSIL